MRSAVLVTGATGVLGPSLVRAFSERGERVRVLCRRPPPVGLIPDGVDLRLGDVSQSRDVAAAVRGVKQVFHLASLLHVSNPEPSLAAAYRSINVGGTRNVAEAARAEGARIIFFSSIAVYGPTHGELVDETSPTRPVGLYAETKRQAEDFLLNNSVQAVVLRLAAVYGPRMKGNYRRLADALRHRRLVAIGNGRNRRTLVHEKDAIRAALLVADHEVTGQVFNVTDGATHPMSEIIAAMCAALGKPEPRWHIPARLARVAAIGADVAGTVVGRRGVYRDLVDKYLESAEVEGEKIQRVLGFRPGYDLDSGWRDALPAHEEPV